MTDLELAWAAGFFEGEGSVLITKPAARNWGALKVDVPNTDESQVRFFAERWGGVVKSYSPVGNRRRHWRWHCAARQAAAFLADIRPFVRSARVLAKIDHGLAFQDQKRRATDEDYRADQWNAYWWMAELNRRGAR